MATIKSRSWGKISGRVGNAVFYMQGEQNCIRSLPLSYHDANTPEQQMQRMRLRGVTTFYGVLMSTLVPLIWRKLALGTRWSGYNLFVRENIRAFDGTGGIIFENLRFSRGRLPAAENMELERSSDSVVHLTWENLSACSRRRMNDRLIVVVVAADASFYLLMPPAFRVERKRKLTEITLEKQEQPVHLYCFFATEKMDGFSDDVHFEIR